MSRPGQRLRPETPLVRNARPALHETDWRRAMPADRGHRDDDALSAPGGGGQPPMPVAPHTPVMAGEVVALLEPVAAGLVVDATVGAGGHARALLEARPDIRLLGIDRDVEAVAAAGTALRPFGDRVRLVHGGFEHLDALLAAESADAVRFVLLDVGVSSLQLDRPGRGFSYQLDGPLDMRMDQSRGISAADVVNGYEEAELRRILATLGEERFASAIARRLVRRRPLSSTAELVEVVKEAIPAPARRTGGHPARRTFQALRLEVNGELEHLSQGLDAAFAALAPGGRLVVLAYHSLEDRMVKRRFASWCLPPDEPRGRAHPGGPTPRPAWTPAGRLPFKRAQRPSDGEIAANPRSRSARLRAVERAAGEIPGGPATPGTTWETTP